MSTANTLDWKKYESITKYIYETLGKQYGVTVKGYGNDYKVTGKSGVSHQIDVITSHTEGSHTYQTAIECKYWKKKVSKDIVMKLVQILEDTGISKGIIVSKSGFTCDGIQYAKHTDIEIVHLREYEEKDLQGSNTKIDIGTLNLNIKIHRTRPTITSIDIGGNRKIEIKDEFEYRLYSYREEERDSKWADFFSQNLVRNHNFKKSHFSFFAITSQSLFQYFPFLIYCL